MAHEHLKVLQDEDNLADVRRVQNLLSEVGDALVDPKHFDELSTALVHLATGRFDVLLVDLGLPDIQGLNTTYKTYAQASEVPIVVLSALDDEELTCKAGLEGAQDYLVKGKMASEGLRP